MAEALALDPECREAAEVLWQCGKAPPPAAKGPGAPPSPEELARIDALLAKVAPGTPEDEARRALAELALVAPDDPRLVDLLRERSGRDSASARMRMPEPRLDRSLAPPGPGPAPERVRARTGRARLHGDAPAP